MPVPDQAHRRTATLLLHHVAQADAAKARAYLQVGGHRLRRRWRAVDDGDADVMLLGSTDPQTEPGLLDDPAVTLRLVDHQEDGADTRVALVRPLQYGPFIDALLAAESRLERLGGPPGGSAAIGSPLDIPHGELHQTLGHTPPGTPPGAPPDLPPDPPSDPLAHDAAITTIPDRLAPPSRSSTRRKTAPLPEPDLLDAPQSFVLRAGDLYRLRHWPPSAMLMHRQHYARIAGYISVRHVGLDDLVQLSKTPKRHCSTFLIEMGSAGLLDVQPSPRAVSRRRGGAANAVDGAEDTIPDAGREHAPHSEDAADSLFERMRRKFGGTRRGR
jgi:hypothetical protein